MIFTLKPYAATKESGLPWLGRIPEHWGIQRAKTLFRPIDVRSSTGEEELLTVSSERGVVKRSSANVTMFKAESYVGYKLCWPGDLVINSLWAWARGLGVSPYHGIVSSAYGVYRLRPRYSDYSAFIHELVRSLSFQWELQVRSKGIWVSRLQLTDDAFLGVPFPLPPPEEQAAIVRFLDYVNRRIRHHIQAKQKLIKLLEEQKQTVIHRAVTRGLNPNVRLKPSGVEWLGDVPTHWEVVLNQRIFKEKIRPHNGHHEVQLSLSQKDGLIATAEMKERSLQTSSYDNWKVTIPGDLVLNRFKAHLGVFFASSLRGIVSFHYGVFSQRRRLLTKYFEHLYHTNIYKAVYAGRSNGMTIGLQNLSNQNFYNVHSIVPPVDEQAAIVEFIERETVRLEHAKRAARHQIALLREFTTQMIAEVVTGKLDVRDAAARLPQHTDETGTRDEVDSEIVSDEDGGDAVDETLEPAQA